MTSTTATPTERDVVIVDGPETAVFLQGQISQDVESMVVGESRYSLLLEPRGRVEVFFRISRTGEHTFVLDTEPGAGAALRSSLERFKLRTKAEFDSPEWSMLAVRGPDAAAVAEATRGTDDAVLVTAWPSDAAVDVLGPAPDAGGVDRGDLQVWGARHGLPTMGVDVREGDIPNETGLLDVAVSFQKGCYRGQELVERIDARAGGRRELRRFEADAAVAPGATVMSDGRAIGEIRSVTPDDGSWIGFAMTSVDAEAAHTDNGVQLVLSEVVVPGR